MKITLPQSVYADVVNLRVDTPVEEIKMQIAVAIHPVVELVLPHGVHHNEVEVYAQHMNGNRPVGEEFVLVKRVAEPKPVEKPDEDVHVEDAEEVAESPPAEEAGGMDEEVVDIPRIAPDSYGVYPVAPPKKTRRQRK